MSKWFAKAQDLSDSDSSESSEEETQKKPTVAASGASKKAPVGVSATSQATRQKFMKNFEDSSESEEEQRVVKTGSDKKKEALNAMFAEIKNHLKINDFGALMTDFERLSEEIERSVNGAGGAIDLLAGDVLPNNVIRQFAKIEDAILECKDKVNKMAKQTAMSYNKLKQKLKKYLSSTGPNDNNYEKQLAKFREAPVWSSDEKPTVAPSSKPKAPAAAAKKPADSDDSDESKSEEDEEDSEESEESEEEEEESEEEKGSGSEEESEDESPSESEEEEEEVNIFDLPRE